MQTNNISELHTHARGRIGGGGGREGGGKRERDRLFDREFLLVEVRVSVF